MLNATYLFSGTGRTLGSYEFVSKTLAGPPDKWKQDTHGNRFADTRLGRVPVPLPDDVLIGIDVRRRDFEIYANREMYLAGEWKKDGWWYYYLFAAALKIPLGLWVLFVLSLAVPLIVARRPEVGWAEYVFLREVPREEHPPQAPGDEPGGRGGEVPAGVFLSVEEAVRAARAALGHDEEGPAGLEEVRALIAELAGQLAAEGEGAAVEAAQAAHEERMGTLRASLAERTEAADRVLRAVASLRAITAPPAMLAAAPKALVEGSRLDRAILSVPRDGALVAEAVHVRGEPEAADRLLAALQAQPMALEHPLLETEALRRRRATLVPDAATNPRVDRATADDHGLVGLRRRRPWRCARPSSRCCTPTAGWAPSPSRATPPSCGRSRAASPRPTRARACDARSARSGAQMRQLLTWLDARSGELADASIGLVPRRESDVPLPEEMEGREERRVERDGSPVLDAVLTRREIEILKLLADGLTNRAIAAELVISGGTVKFHVNSILRKLHVANRAEAVARYYALLDAGRRDR